MTDRHDIIERLAEQMAIGFRRMGGLAALLRSPNGAVKIAEIAAREAAAALAAAEKRATEAERELAELDFLRHEGGPTSVAALEQRVEKAKTILVEMDTRDKRNGFLPVWWREKLDALLAALRDTGQPDMDGRDDRN